jgi:peptide deformylase
MMFKAKSRHVVHTAGDPVLKAVAKPVAAVTPEILALAERMLQATRVFDGIGLAAPQAGESLRMVVFDVPMDSMGENPTPGELQLLPRMPLIVINPEILSTSGNLTEYTEGCLSVPDIFAPVIRPERVLFRATTLQGEVIECECGGLLGRCIQHELDHLDGKLFTDRLTPADAQKIEKPLRQLVRYGEKHKFLRVKVK